MTISDNIVSNNNTGFTYFSGGSSIDNGGNILMYGGANAANADMTFRADTTAWMFYDHSATSLSILNSTSISMSGTLVVTGAATFSSTVATGALTVTGTGSFTDNITFATNKGIKTAGVGQSLVLAADNSITNLTLSGASGSELATFAGNVTLSDGKVTITDTANETALDIISSVTTGTAVNITASSLTSGSALVVGGKTSITGTLTLGTANGTLALADQTAAMTIASSVIAYGTSHASRPSGLLVPGDIYSNNGLGLHGVTPPAQAAHIGNPAGGATIDGEARVAIDAILVALEEIGITASV
jgi:hypothetical protein